MKRRSFIKKTTVLAATSLILPKLVFSSNGKEPLNVLIIGDSISIGYTPFVRQLLKTKANVFRPMLKNGNPENCEGTTKGVKNIDRWLGSTKWDVIHFNFGLHDIKHVDPVTGENSNNPNHPVQANLNQYKKNLKKIVGKLNLTGAKLIFATTTPYPDELSGPLRDPGMPKKYNKVAENIMNKNNIAINDLYNFVLPRMAEIQRPNNVHFTEEGYKALAKKVADKIV